MNYSVIESQKATDLSLAVSVYADPPDWGASKPLKLDWQHIYDFKRKGKIVKFKHGIPCYFYYESDDLFGECPTFSLISTGRTKEEILEHFDIDLEVIYDQYFLENDSNLTKDAIDLKKQFGNLLKK